MTRLAATLLVLARRLAAQPLEAGDGIGDITPPPGFGNTPPEGKKR